MPGTDRQGLDVMAKRALVVWGGLLAAAILNGALREKWLVPRIGERIGHWVSPLILCPDAVSIGRQGVKCRRRSNFSQPAGSIL